MPEWIIKGGWCKNCKHRAATTFADGTPICKHRRGPVRVALPTGVAEHLCSEKVHSASPGIVWPCANWQAEDDGQRPSTCDQCGVIHDDPASVAREESGRKKIILIDGQIVADGHIVDTAKGETIADALERTGQ